MADINNMPSGAEGDPIHVSTESGALSPEEVARAAVLAAAVVEARHVVRRMFRRALLGYLILALAVGFALWTTRNETRARCRDAALNRAAIRNTLSAGRDPINLKPGDAGYAYYHVHPQEARAAHDNRVAALQRFPDIHCP